MDDEPDPEKASAKQKAKDELNIFSDSSSESEEEDKELNKAGKELKAMLKVSIVSLFYRKTLRYSRQ